MRLRILGSPFLGTGDLWVWVDIPSMRPIGVELEAIINSLRGADYLARRRILWIRAYSRPVPPEDQLVDLGPTPPPRNLDPDQDLVEQGVLEGDTLLVLCIDRKEASAAVWRAESLISNRFPASAPATRTSCRLSHSSRTLAPTRLPDVLTQAELRIFVARAQGSGHQGCSVQLMKSLRRLGFRGLFDVVYDELLITEVTDLRIGQKLVDLLPGYVFNSGDNDVQTPDAFGLNVRVTSLKHFQSVGAPLKYAFTGALDQLREHEDILDKLKVTFFTQLQPMDWTNESGIRQITYRHESTVERHDLSKLYPLGYIYDDPILSEAATTIRQLLTDGGQQAKADAVLAFDHLCDRRADYHTQIGYGFSTSMSDGDVPCSLFNLVLGALRLQDREESHRGIVIGIAGWNSEAEIARLNLAFQCRREGGLDVLFDRHRNVIDSFEQLQAHLRTRLLTHESACRVRVIDVLADGANERIAGVQPSTVLLVALGRIPEPVFNHLVKRSSLPNCFESVNGMDRERQNKPYIHVAKDVSNKFPASDFVDGRATPETDAVAEQCMTLGRMFQGSGSLLLWVRNYCVTRPEEVFLIISEMDQPTQRALNLRFDETHLVLYVEYVEPSSGSVRFRLTDNVKKTLTRSQVQKLFTSNKSALQVLNARWRRNDPDLLIGDFFQAALNPVSAVSRYFAKLRTLSTTRDQVRLALDDLATLPGATSVAPAQASSIRTDTSPSSATRAPPEVRDDPAPVTPVRVQLVQPPKTLTLLSLTWVTGGIPERVTLSLQGRVEPIVNNLTFARKNEAVHVGYTQLITTPVSAQLSGQTGYSSYEGSARGLQFYNNGTYEENLSVGSGYITLRYSIADAR